MVYSPVSSNHRLHGKFVVSIITNLKTIILCFLSNSQNNCMLTMDENYTL